MFKVLHLPTGTCLKRYDSITNSFCDIEVASEHLAKHVIQNYSLLRINKRNDRLMYVSLYFPNDEWSTVLKEHLEIMEVDNV